MRRLLYRFERASSILLMSSEAGLRNDTGGR